MRHHCHASQCTTPCKPEYLMCPHHWRMVPASLQAAVYAAYRPGQCNDKEPSTAWFKAADAAIVHVALREGVLTEDQAAIYRASRAEFYEKWAARESGEYMEGR